MIKAVCAAAALGMAVAPISASVAAPVQDIIQQQFDKATQVFKDKGMVESGWQQRGSLKTGAEVSYTVTLKAGVNALVGACDTDCSNIDLYVSKGGAAVDQNIEDDDFPIVIVEEAGTYTVRLVMKSCGSASCAVGVKGFKKQ